LLIVQIVCTDGEFQWSSFLLAASSNLMNELLGKQHLFLSAKPLYRKQKRIVKCLPYFRCHMIPHLNPKSKIKLENGIGTSIPVFRIRIGFMRIRIRIQHFCWMRIRIQIRIRTLLVELRFSNGSKVLV
jgi:hypothetical protein